MQLKGVENRALHALLAERAKNGRFVSFADFLHRVRMAPSDVRVLIKAGLFDSVEPEIPRPGLIWLYRYWLGAHGAAALGQWYERQLQKAKRFREYERKVALQHEFSSLGALVSCSPLELFQDKIAGIDRVRAKELPRYVGKPVQVVGWLITGKLVQTSENEPMEFYSFEDETAMFETVFFPKAYRQYCHLMIHHYRPFLLRGVVQEDRGAISLNVQQVRPIASHKSLGQAQADRFAGDTNSILSEN